MNKRLGFFLVALLVVPMLLTGCSSDSPDTAEDYMNAVLEGKVEEAQKLACDDAFAAKTAEIAAAYAGQYATMKIDTDQIDLAYDIAKGGNDKEVLVSGSITYVPVIVAAEPAAEAETEAETEAEATPEAEAETEATPEAETETAAEAEANAQAETAAVLSEIEIEYELKNDENTLVILMLDKKDDEWCVSSDSTFGKVDPAWVSTDDE